VSDDAGEGTGDATGHGTGDGIGDGTAGGRRFLLATWDGGGNVPPELGVARRLVAAGHAVHVLGDPTLEADALAAGCTFSPWGRAPHRRNFEPSEDPIQDWESKNPLVLLGRSATA